MRIELDLTEFELLELKGSLHSEELSSKVTRAIERAESFVDDDTTADIVNFQNKQVDCAGCNGDKFVRVVGKLNKMPCYFCSGTGKEWI